MAELGQYHIYTHCLDNEQQALLDRVTAYFNVAQPLFKLHLVGTRDLSITDNTVSWKKVVNQPQPEHPEIVITSFHLADNWFSHTWCNLSLITVADWNVAFEDWRDSPPGAAPDAYLLQALTTALLLSTIRQPEETLAHRETTGCIADLCADKSSVAIKLRSGFLCSRCRKMASEAGLSGVYLDAIQALLDRIRLLALGRPPQPHLPKEVSEEDIQTFISEATAPPGFSIPALLVEALQRRDITVLIGSGMSLQSDVKVSYADNLGWQQFPGWVELSQRLRQRAITYRGLSVQPQETETLDEFLTYLDFLRIRLGVDLYYPSAISDVFLPKIEATGIANKLLFHLPLKWLLTTNYDFVLNYAAPAGTATFTWRESRQAREYLQNSHGLPPILKLHGCASRVDTVVLTAMDYHELSRHEAYNALTRQVFENQTILFLGYGLNDPLDLDMALKSSQVVGAAQGPKFALIQQDRASGVAEKFPNVHVMGYQTHKDIPNILALLIRAAN